MPKAIIEYSLPEELYEYNIHYYADRMLEALEDISKLLREVEKGCIEDCEELYNEKLFEKIRDILADSGMWDVEN